MKKNIKMLLSIALFGAALVAQASESQESENNDPVYVRIINNSKKVAYFSVTSPYKYKKSSSDTIEEGKKKQPNSVGENDFITIKTWKTNNRYPAISRLVGEYNKFANYTYSPTGNTKWVSLTINPDKDNTIDKSVADQSIEF